MPLLAIRHMVPTDFPFLRGDKDLLASYLKIYGREIPAHIRDDVEQAVRRYGLEIEEPRGSDALHPRVRAVLQEAGVSFHVHRHADQPFVIDGPHAFARALGYPVQRITKSLFVRCVCHGAYRVIVCSADQKVRLYRLAALLGCRRIELASPEELAVVLGFPRFGVSPIAAGPLPVMMEAGLFAFDTVLIAGGEVAVEIEIAPADLQRVANAEVFSNEAGSVALTGRSQARAPASGDDV